MMMMGAVRDQHVPNFIYCLVLFKNVTIATDFSHPCNQ
jgi:hypothetical protein